MFRVYFDVEIFFVIVRFIILVVMVYVIIFSNEKFLGIELWLRVEVFWED